MVLGGALACLELARRAAGLGLAVYASHLHDGPIARAATLALARALPGRVLPCGI
jgi:L-alanine-DL-glutamate epimerase-like enolase superfamily enzyme